MPIIQVPFPSVEVVYDERLCAKYKRIGFFTLSDLSPTIGLDLDFIPHDDDAYDELCVGVVIASAETYGHLSELDVTYARPSLSSKGNWVREGLHKVFDKHAFYIYKLCGVGPQSRSLRNFTLDIESQWLDWVVFAGIHMRTDVLMMTTRARGNIKVIQSLSVRYENIFSATSDKRLYREEDKEDKRGRKRRIAEYKKECDEKEAKALHDLLELV